MNPQIQAILQALLGGGQQFYGSQMPGGGQPQSPQSSLTPGAPPSPATPNPSAQPGMPSPLGGGPSPGLGGVSSGFNDFLGALQKKMAGGM